MKMKMKSKYVEIEAVNKEGQLVLENGVLLNHIIELPYVDRYQDTKGNIWLPVMLDNVIVGFKKIIKRRKNE